MKTIVTHYIDWSCVASHGRHGYGTAFGQRGQSMARLRGRRCRIRGVAIRRARGRVLLTYGRVDAGGARRDFAPPHAQGPLSARLYDLTSAMVEEL